MVCYGPINVYAMNGPMAMGPRSLLSRGDGQASAHSRAPARPRPHRGPPMDPFGGPVGPLATGDDFFLVSSFKRHSNSLQTT